MATTPSTGEDYAGKEGSSSLNIPTLCVHAYIALIECQNVCVPSLLYVISP